MLWERGRAESVRLGRFIAAAFASLMLAFALAAAGSGVALAHDWLVSSTPAEGESLDTAPESASLTFSGQVLELGAEVALLNAATGELVDLPEPPQVAETSLVQPLPPLERGAYVLNWRVVSEDGHPVSGSIPFAVDAEVITPTAAAQSTTEDAPQSGPSAALWLALAAAVVLLGAVVAVIWRQRSQRQPDATGDAAAVDPSDNQA